MHLNISLHVSLVCLPGNSCSESEDRVPSSPPDVGGSSLRETFLSTSGTLGLCWLVHTLSELQLLQELKRLS